MPEVSASRWLTTAGWDDVPHLDEREKVEMLASTPPHLRDARSKGVPSLGSGAIYPIPWNEITVKPFEIPDYWPRAYALDPGWNWTAALWMAWNTDTGEWVVYAAYKRGEERPITHAAAIRARGDWIPGLIDPAARGRGQIDGVQILAEYQQQGLNLTPADTRDVEAGIYAVWQDLSIGRGKVFSNLREVEAEYRIYRRDEKGRIVKEHDHLLDCLRMLRRNGRAIAKPKPARFAAAAFDGAKIGDRRAGY